MRKWEKVAAVLAAFTNMSFSLNPLEIAPRLILTAALVLILWKKT